MPRLCGRLVAACGRRRARREPNNQQSHQQPTTNTTSSRSHHLPDLLIIASLRPVHSSLNFATTCTAFAMPTSTSVAAAASKLYPASILPIAAQNYLWIRQDLSLCPRGVAIGSIAQTCAILLSVPLVAKSATEGKVPFISIDWLHGIEQLLLVVPNHIMATSFRNTVLSYKRAEPLPESYHEPMLRATLISFAAIFAIAYAQIWYAGNNWTSFRFLGGILDPPMPGLSLDQQRIIGGPSFAVWIAHWVMFLDFGNQMKYMMKWSKCINIPQWRHLGILHFPWALANLTVFFGHLCKDQHLLFKALHPIFIFVGSISTLYGTIQLAINVPNVDKDERKKLFGLPRGRNMTSKKLEITYSSSVVLFAAILSYATVYLSTLF